MKKKFLLGMLIGIVLGFGVSCGVYFLTKTDVDWKTYMNDKLIPLIVTAFSTIITIYGLLLPIIKKVNLSTDLFGKATNDVSGTAAYGKDTKAMMENYDKRFDEFTKEIRETVSPLASGIQNTEKMCRIGFMNTDELVKKGYAAEIAKVGEDNETETET